MNFINPIEILQLQNNIEEGGVNAISIKRQKKRLFAEMELSDSGLYNYNGVELTKSDCKRAIDELENDEKKEFYYHLTNNQRLNTFLTTGNESLFESFTQESIYTLPEFVSFINPFFSEQFDRILLKVFKANDLKLLSSILRTQILINQSNINAAFKSLSNELKNRIEEINKITEEIKNKDRKCTEESIKEIVTVTREAFPIELVNTLPSYFQSQINKAGNAINSLDLAIDKEFGISESSLHLMEHLLKLNIESVAKKTFEKNYEITKTRYNDKVEEEANAPLLTKWAVLLREIEFIIKRIEETIYKPSVGENKLKEINLVELNSLPSFADEIRNSYVYAYRSMAISIWNKHKNIDSAISVMNKSFLINSSKETQTKLNGDLNELLEIKKEQERLGKPIRSAPEIDNMYGIGFAMYKDTHYFTFFHVPIIPLARYNCKETYQGYRFFGRLKLHRWQKIWQLGLPVGILVWIAIWAVNETNHSSYYFSGTDKLTAPAQLNVEQSKAIITPDKKIINATGNLSYKHVLMKNGNIPNCSGFTPLYDYSINNKLIVSADFTDAAVKIFNYETSKSIRFVFIKEGTTYSIKNIPEGKYYLKIAYGKDWSVKETETMCKGHFASHASYKKDADLYNFNKKHYADGRVSIPYYTLKLFTSYTLNDSDKSLSTNSITEEDFFNN